MKGARLEQVLRGDKELKEVRPQNVAREPLIYAWRISEDLRGETEVAQPVVRRLIALGTGLDHAVADTRVSVEAPEAEGLIKHDPGSSPCAGTLDSLVSRHKAALCRLVGGGLREDLPTVRHSTAGRHRAASQMMLTLRSSVGDGPDRPLPIAPEAAAVLAYAIRKHLAKVLIDALARRRDNADFSAAEVDRLVLGRGAGPDDKDRRVSIMPLPSIGHDYSDGLLRRVLVSVRAMCPIPAEVIRRALTDAEVQVDLSDTATSSSHLRLARPIDVVADANVASRENSMLDRYAGTARVWRSVSPVVLPGTGGWVTPTHDPEQKARMDEQRRAREDTLFRRAMRDSGIDMAEVERVQLRREPFGAHQPRADATWRLPKNGEGRRWLAGRPRVHAEIVFTQARTGPLTVGDGRSLGLGLFQAAPSQPPGHPEIARFRIQSERRPRIEHSVRIGDSLRRALMSGGGRPPTEFSGHDASGPLRADPAHGHAFFLSHDADADGLIDHLIVYCRRGFTDDAVARLRCLERLLWPSDAAQTVGQRTRDALAITLEALGKPNTAELFGLLGPSRVWSSVTPYLRPWHIKERDRAARDDALSAAWRFLPIEVRTSGVWAGRARPLGPFRPGLIRRKASRRTLKVMRPSGQLRRAPNRR
jgi:CRISPR-associated protein Csb2